MKKFAAIALALIVAMSSMFATVATAADKADDFSFRGFKINAESGVVVDVENMLIYGLKPLLHESELGNYLEKGEVDEMIVSDKYLGTGSTITLIKDGVQYVFTVVIFGDVTGDSVSDVIDAAQMQRITEGFVEPEEVVVLAGDTDNDGELSKEDYQEQVNVLADTNKTFDQKANGTNEDVETEVEDQVYTGEQAKPVEDEEVTVKFNDGCVSSENYTIGEISEIKKDANGELYATVEVTGKGLFGGSFTVDVKIVSLLQKIVDTVNGVIADAGLADVVSVERTAGADVTDIKVKVDATNLISGDLAADVNALNGLLAKIDDFRAKNLTEVDLVVEDYVLATDGAFSRSAIKALGFDLASGIFTAIANASSNTIKSYNGEIVTNDNIPAEAFKVDFVMTGTGRDIDKVKAFAAKIANFVAFDVVDGNAVIDITMPAGFATTVVDVIGDGDVDKAIEQFNSLSVSEALTSLSLVDASQISSSSANAITKLLKVACGLDSVANKVLSEVTAATVTDMNGATVELLNGADFAIDGEASIYNAVNAVMAILSKDALDAKIANFVNGDVYTAEFDVTVEYKNISEKIIVNFDLFSNVAAPDVIEETSAYFNGIIADLGLANAANVSYDSTLKSAVATLDASAIINGNFAFNEDALNGLYTDIKGFFDDNYGASTIVIGKNKIVTNGKINKTALKNFLFEVAAGFFVDVADMSANNVIRSYNVVVSENGSDVTFDLDFVIAGTDAHIAKLKNIAAKVAECISLSTVNGNAVIDITLPAGFRNTVVDALSEDGTVESAIATFNGLKVRSAFEALALIDAETISAANASDIERIILFVADYSSVINKLLGKVTSATAYDLDGNSYKLLNGSAFDGSKIADSDNVFGAAVESIMAIVDDATLDADIANFTTGNGVYTVAFDVAVSIGGIKETVIVNFDMFGLK